MRAIKPF
jgi:hypothetical protein